MEKWVSSEKKRPLLRKKTHQIYAFFLNCGRSENVSAKEGLASCISYKEEKKIPIIRQDTPQGFRPTADLWPSYSANGEICPSFRTVVLRSIPRRSDTCHSPMKDWLPPAFTCHSVILSVKISYFPQKRILVRNCLKLLAPHLIKPQGMLYDLSRLIVGFLPHHGRPLGLEFACKSVSFRGYSSLHYSGTASVYCHGDDQRAFDSPQVPAHGPAFRGLSPLSGILRRISGLSSFQYPGSVQAACVRSVQHDWCFCTQLVVCLAGWSVFSCHHKPEADG